MKNRINSEDNYIGLDLGSSSFKLVQLVGEGKPKLNALGAVNVPNGLINSDSKEDVIKAAGYISKLVEDTKVTTTNVVSSLPSTISYSSIIKTPMLDAKQLDEAIKFQAEKYIPIPADQAKIDWSIIGPTKDNNEMEVLLVAAPLEKAQKYLDIISEAGLDLLSLEINSIAHIRALTNQDTGSVAIVDLGNSAADISLIDNQVPKLIRSVSIGMRNFVYKVGKQMNVDNQQALTLLTRFGIAPNDKVNNLNIIKSELDAIITEIARSVQYFSSHISNGELSKIIVTGGVVGLPGLIEYFQSQLPIPIEVGNSWLNISTSKTQKPYLDKALVGFATATGLALRNKV